MAAGRASGCRRPTIGEQTVSFEKRYASVDDNSHSITTAGDITSIESSLDPAAFSR
jgi:hypothetical protein